MMRKSIAITAACLCFVSTSYAADPSATLLCVATVGGQRLSQTLVVDYDARTVNGIRANFGENEITYRTPYTNIATGRKSVMDHTLNRLDGTYWSGDPTAVYPAPPPRFSCARAPNRQF